MMRAGGFHTVAPVAAASHAKHPHPSLPPGTARHGGEARNQEPGRANGS